MSRATKFLAGLAMVMNSYAAIAQERDSLKSENAGLKSQLQTAQAALETANQGGESGLSADDLDKALAQMESVVGPISEAAGAQTAPTPSSVSIAAATTAPTDTILVAGPVDETMVGSAVAGPGIADGTTVSGIGSDGSLALSRPTTDDHAGDGTETLTITPQATEVLDNQADGSAALGSKIDPLTGQAVTG